jgi:hypothetical protein
MNNYCTYFDKNYIDKGLALLSSIQNLETEDYHIWVMCMDSETKLYLDTLKLNYVTVFTLNELEASDSGLSKTKILRNQFEHYAACKPALILYLLNKNKEINSIHYIDADIYFFSRPSLLNSVVKGFSIAASQHMFKINKSSGEKKGIYNAGWIFVRNVENGLKCLKYWRKCCLTWCKDQVEEGKYADQKYIENFALIVNDFGSIKNAGVNAAPWNIKGSKVRKVKAGILINEVRLIFYHFHGLTFIGPRICDTGLSNYFTYKNRNVSKFIYSPYIQKIKATSLNNNFNVDLIRNTRSSYKYDLRSLIRILKRILLNSFIIYRN